MRFLSLSLCPRLYPITDINLLFFLIYPLKWRLFTPNFVKFTKNKNENNFLGNLPLIENENVKFERAYYLNEENNIIFKTILDNEIENEEILLNISFDELKDYFEKVGFKTKEIIIKEQHNCKATGFWKTNSVKYNFLLIAHEYLFVFKK